MTAFLADTIQRKVSVVRDHPPQPAPMSRWPDHCSKHWVGWRPVAVLLRATVGDLFRITVDNQLPTEISVYWRGIALHNDMDGVPRHHSTTDQGREQVRERLQRTGTPAPTSNTLTPASSSTAASTASSSSTTPPNRATTALKESWCSLPRVKQRLNLSDPPAWDLYPLWV